MLGSQVLYGILNLDGRPVDPGGLEAIERVAAQLGSRSTSSATPAFIALGGASPATHSPTGVIAVAQGRLDNRDDLRARLHVAKGSSDSEMVLSAYLAWGETTAEHLLGDWIFAVWDPREQTLLLARDHTAAQPLYYHASSTTLSFCSSIKGLLALDWVPKTPDMLHVAKVLATWPGDGAETAYEDIRRVPAGHQLIAHKAAVRLKRYWTPQPAEDLGISSESEYLEAFLALYTEAVRTRMGDAKTLGATLSGGLDSSSVCALAARELRSSGGVLNVFSSAPQFDAPPVATRFIDESPYVEASRDFIGNLSVHYVRAEHISPMSGIDRALDLNDDIVHGAANAYWIVGIMEEAQKLGVSTLLTGALGNFTVSWAGDRFRTPLQKARLLLLLSWAKPLRNGIRQIQNRGQAAWLAASPLNPQFVHAHDLAGRRRKDGWNPDFITTPNPRKLQLQSIEVALRTGISYLSEIGAGYGISGADPTGDKRIIEFCLATPIEIFQRDGMNRRLIRLAMDGLLPDQVRLNTLKGQQAADLGRRLAANSEEVLDALDQCEHHPLSRELLDLPKMRRVFDAVRSHPTASSTAEVGAILMRGLMAGRFLARF